MPNTQSCTNECTALCCEAPPSRFKHSLACVCMRSFSLSHIKWCEHYCVCHRIFFLSIHGICNDTHSPNIVGSLLLSMMIILFLEDEKFIRYSLHSNADRIVRSLCTLMYRVDHKTCNYCNKFRKPGNRDGNFWTFFEKLPTFKEFVPTSAAQFPIKNITWVGELNFFVEIFESKHKDLLFSREFSKKRNHLQFMNLFFCLN